jgi:Beta-propeller repeat
LATPAGLAVDGAGSSVVVGYLQWRVDFGGGVLLSAGLGDIYLAKYAANGTHVWSKRFGGLEDDRPKGVAVDSAGNVYITGLFRGSVDFGGGLLTAPPFTANAFLAKYNSNGDHLWSLRFGNGPCEGTAVAVDGVGNVILAGNFYTTADFGGGAMTTAGGADIVLAKYNSSGAHLWSRQIGGTSDDSALRVAADTTTGEIFATGFFGGSVNFGGGALTSAGMTDIFLAKYSSSNGHAWSRRWGGAQDDKAYGLALDQLGSVVVTGVFTGNVDFGGGTLINSGGGDILLVKYSVDGAHTWSRGYGTTSSVTDTGYGVDFDSAGRVLLTGSVGATIDFGGGALTGDGWTNPILAKFGSDGSHIWSKRYSGGGAHANARAVAAAVGDNVVAAGDFSASINFGGATLTSPGGTDTYLVKLGP